MNESFIESQWAVLCGSARTNAQRLSEGLSSAAAELIHSQAGKLCRLDPPHDKASLERMYVRRMALSAVMTAIARADAMCRNCRDAASEVHIRLQQFCDGELPFTSDAFLQMQVENVTLTRDIASICAATYQSGT